MRLKHNMGALNANRMLSNVTQFNIAKSVEKLSSGYKINRAADDAAGLAISEKMRRAIRGLTMASVNTQDGISLVQTAEGGLDEIHTMLQRMNELAIKAANETYTDVDRSYIDEEVSALKKEINRVANSVTFNEIYLLKTEADTTAVTSLDIVGYSASLLNTGDFTVEGGTYGTDYTYAGGTLTILTDKALTISGTGVATTDKILVNSSNGNANITLSNVNINVSSSPNSVAIDTNGNNVTLTLAGTNQVTSGASAAGIQVENAATLTINGTGKLTAVGGNNSAGIGSSSSTPTGDITIISGDITAIGGSNGAGIGGGLSSSVGNITIKGGNITAVGGTYGAGIGGGFAGGSGNVIITGGNISATAGNTNVAGIGAGFSGASTAISVSNVSMTIPTSTNLLGNTEYTVQVGNQAEQTVTTDASGNLNLDLSGYNNETVTVTNDQGGILFTGSLVTSNHITLSAISTGQDQDSDGDSNNVGEKVIKFKVGYLADDFIEYTIKDMNCTAIGVQDTSVATATLANSAIDAIKGAINAVSEYRAYIGATQNRLEATYSNLLNVIENTTSAESLIRDTDMATEMVSHSNNLIVQQAAQAMLAQANQMSEGVLALLT